MAREQGAVNVDRRAVRRAGLLLNVRAGVGVRADQRVEHARRRSDPVDHPERRGVRRDHPEQRGLITHRA
jgi:hypothetical protein